MPLAAATLGISPLNLAVLWFADFADMPLRGALAPCPVRVPPGLPDSDADCAGLIFDATAPILSISPVDHGEGGAGAFEFVLAADPADPAFTALLTAADTPALYFGRRVRLWLAIWGAGSGAGAVGAVQLRPLYRGYMVQARQEASADAYRIIMRAENALAVRSGAQRRGYANSRLYDAGDSAGDVMRGQGGTLGFVDYGGGGGNAMNRTGFEQMP